jgi:hypothetical protein
LLALEITGFRQDLRRFRAPTGFPEVAKKRLGQRSVGIGQVAAVKVPNQIRSAKMNGFPNPQHAAK